jgi:hypothetical protein
MKQFQKYGVAAAVASVAAGAVAQEVSNVESGDLAIIPYYSVLDGKNTGMHIINTTDSTQVIKVRLRRGADSKDALDFNVVMSPRDEWTANIGAGGDTGVQVTTNDTTCTVPEFPNGVAQMPDTYAEGATEGYVEIIAMGETATELSHLAVAAKHQAATGAPFSCDIVRNHFYRVAAASVGNPAVRGAHTSNLGSSGVCLTAAGQSILGAVTALGVCPGGAGGATGGVTANLSPLVNADDNALKVSYFITDSDGGLEAGDNAVMVSGFAVAPMLTNQQPLSFGTAGILQFDPLNFELPNLAYGAYESSNAARQAAGADGVAAISDGSLFDGVRDALDADALINDWASFEAADGSTVAADWVVTLPGQYTMNNPICELYDSYALAATACNTAQRAAVATAGGDELPLILASNTTSNPLSGTSNLSLWDREEMAQIQPDTPADSDLGFSPGGSAGDPTQLAVLAREVNVISWNDNSSLNTADTQEEDLGLGVNVQVPMADRGWAQLAIVPATAADSTIDLGGLVADDADLTPADGAAADENPVANPDFTAAIGIAVWERSFADQAGNYGRAVEHSTVSSLGRN